jgi:hypothetical protein
MRVIGERTVAKHPCSYETRYSAHDDDFQRASDQDHALVVNGGDYEQRGQSRGSCRTPPRPGA